MSEPISRRALLGAAGGALAAGAAVAVGINQGGNSSTTQSVPGAPEVPGSTATNAPTTVPATVAPTTTAVPKPPPRTLVVVQLGGGNDGLNTIVPDIGFYRDLRSQLAIAEDQLVPLTGTTSALHPSLAPLVPLWDAGQLTAVQGVGLPAQTFSHFTAMDTWWNGAAVGSERRGWLGRWLDETINEPVDGDDPATAIGLGSGSPALRGNRALSLLIRAPENFVLRAPAGVDETVLRQAFATMAAPLVPNVGIAASQAAIGPTVDAVDMVQSVAASRGAGGYGPDQRITAGLDTAAGLIELRQATRVVVVGVSGFDTHANQLTSHATLLADFADGIAQFFKRLESGGLADSTLVMTTSEFGRRIRENGSAGTDHGTAGTQLLVGPGLSRSQVVGDVAQDGNDPDNLAVSIDARSYYATALQWLGDASDNTIDAATAEALGATAEPLGLLRP